MDNWIRDAIIGKAYSLQETLNALKFKEYFSEAPLELLDALLEVIEAVIDYYDILLKSNAEDREFIRVGLFLSYLHGFLEEIKTVDLSDIPIELSPLLEQTMKSYDKESLIYLKPIKEYNYTYINNMDFIFNFPENVFGYKKGSRRRIATISFPLSEKNNVLLHCIFSHEIGHHFDNLFLIRDNVIPNIQIDKKILDEKIERIMKTMAQTKKEVEGKPVSLDLFVEIGDIRAHEVESYTKILANWVNELISDAIGACLFGPAYLFSLVEIISSASNYESHSDSHPPSFIRIDIVLKILKDLDYLKLLADFEEINKKIKDLSEASSFSFSKNETSLELRLLKASIQPVLSVLIDETKKIVKPLYDLAQINIEIKELIKLIKKLIPPNEIIVYEERRSYPANPISILNAAWIVRLEYINDIYHLLGAKTMEDQYRARVLLNEHVLKALELTEIHKNLMEGIKRASSQKKK